MGGGGERWPYPKYVWSPSGGWWSRPKNWVANTMIVGAGTVLIALGIFRFSAENERRLTPPIGKIPSMRWSKEFRNQEYQAEVKEHYDQGIYIGNQYSFLPKEKKHH